MTDQQTYRKGIALAGGAGPRRHLATAAISEQMLPVYDKPMIYYPLSTLKLAGMRDILLISTPQNTPRFEQLLGDGSNWGLNISYAVQPSPGGLAQAFVIGANFVGTAPCALILGDNVFHGSGPVKKLSRANAHRDGVSVFAYRVKDPQRFGVVELDADNKAIRIEEKPANPKSGLAVTGLHFDDHRFIEITRPLTRQHAVNWRYRRESGVPVASRAIRRGIRPRSCLRETGTHADLLEASNFVEILEKRKG